MRRLFDWLGRAVGAGLTLGLAAVLFSILQVVVLRFSTPPLTLTMIDQGIRRGEWPDVQHRSLDELGEPVARAVVASEDQRFFLHSGFDWIGICEAVEDYRDGGRLRGGSTITQQVARNAFLWQGRSWIRKGLEAWYTIWLELLLPKERILEVYLNVAETGPGVFGMEAGARHWYGVSASGLSEAKAARLAGLLPSPRKRSVKGGAASKRARWVVMHPAPFPGDRGYDLSAEAWEESGAWPLWCP